MKSANRPSEAVRNILCSNTNVVDLVDSLMNVCHDERLHFHWELKGGHVQPLEGGQSEELQVPLSKSQFRAVLARVAAMCSEGSPCQVSPYGGESELQFGPDQKRSVKVVFANTPDTQTLDIRPVRRAARIKPINNKQTAVSKRTSSASAKPV